MADAAADTWTDWGQGSLATAAVLEEVAAEHLETANEWAAYGNVEAAREELAEAQIASELGAESAVIAEAQFEIAAEFREHADDGSATDDQLSGADDTFDTGQFDGDDDGSSESDQGRD